MKTMRNALVISGLLLALVGLSGCYRPLFSEDLPRHQYLEYDQARNGMQPTEDPDVFGNPQPALRRRLDPQ